MILIENTKAMLYENDSFTVRDCSIYVKDDKIVKILEKGQEAEASLTEGEDVYTIDGKNRLAIPGLINSHTHCYMTLFRNLADDVPFTHWLFDTILPMEDKMTAEDAYWGTLLGNLEMIQTGTTSYIDMHIMINKSCEAVKDSGLRVAFSRGLVGEKRDDEGGIRRINEQIEEIKNWKDDNRFNFFFAPHAPYTVGLEFGKQISEYAKEYGIGINTHLAEGADEIKGIREKYGMTPIEYALEAGFFDVHCVAAHCVHLTYDDMDILKSHDVSVAVNPVSNMKLANGFSSVPDLLDRDVNVVIGTDGAASNNTLNMFREMTIESLLHKGLRHDAEAVSAVDVLKMATVNGARAFGKPGEIGELKEGAKADIVLVDLNTPAFYPRNNLVSALVYSCNGSETDTVIVDGKILMEKKEIKTIDVERVYYEMGKRSAKKI